MRFQSACNSASVSDSNPVFDIVATSRFGTSLPDMKVAPRTKNAAMGTRSRLGHVPSAGQGSSTKNPARSLGSMQGTYRMVRDDGTAFDAEIAPFTLATPMRMRSPSRN